MHKLTHGFEINSAKCNGCMACMRTCPTKSIRIKDGKAQVLSEFCIDCGYCLRSCSFGAISPTTRSLIEFRKFKYKVAVISPVLFGQFPANITMAHVVEGLKKIGFDEVYIPVVEIAMVNQAIRNCMEKWKGPLPLIPIACPAIVRLVQVSYPVMVNQLIQIEIPRELAGREVKKKYSEKLGIDRDDIAAIYVTSCQGKTISILEPAEGIKSNLDGAIGISDIYNEIMTAVRQINQDKNYHELSKDLPSTREMIQWCMGEAQRENLKKYRCMSLTGLMNVIRVFDDIEKGRLRNIDFLDCYACWGGCGNGNLTVDNLYVTLDKLHRLVTQLPEKNLWVESEVQRRYSDEEVRIKGPIRPRPIKWDRGELKERIKCVKESEDVFKTLPGLNCGLCGTPSCKTLAGDIASGDARKTDCIFYSKDRLEKLREIYLKNRN